MLWILIVVTAAHAGPKREARALFERYVDREAAHDPAVFDLFSDDAVLRVRRAEGENPNDFDMNDVRAQAPGWMAAAKADAASVRYDQLSFKRNAEGFLVTAVRTAEQACVPDGDFRAQIAERNGVPTIVRMDVKATGVSRCVPSAALAARLAQAEAWTAGRLPIPLSEHIQLTAMWVDGSTLHIDQTLLSDIDPATLAQLVPVMMRQECSDATTRALLEKGAWIRTRLQDEARATLTAVTLTRGQCSMIMGSGGNLTHPAE